MNSNAVSQLFWIFSCFACMGMFFVGVVVIVIILVQQQKKTTTPLTTTSPTPPDAETKPEIKSEPVPSLSDPPPEAKEHFVRARELLKNVEWEKVLQDETLKSDIASEFALAVKKAGGLYPSAHAFLGFFLFLMNREKDATNHLNIALQQNPKEFTARATNVMIALQGLRQVKLGVGNFLHLEGNAYDAAFGTLFKSIGSLSAAATASATQMKLKNEVNALADTFKEFCQTTTDASEYASNANFMIVIGDGIKDLPMPGGRPNLYSIVSNTATPELGQSEQEKEVVDVRRKAEGRSLLFKP